MRKRGSCARRRDACGFTLVELLAVLLVIGLLAGLLSAAWNPDKRGVLRLESERLAQLLSLAAAEARLSGRPIAWTTDAGQYRFWQLNGNSGWSEIRDRDLFRARVLPQGIAIRSLRIENTRPQAAIRLEFNPYGPGRSFHMEVSLAEEGYLIVASPIGEIRATPAVGGGAQ